MICHCIFTHERSSRPAGRKRPARAGETGDGPSAVEAVQSMHPEEPRVVGLAASDEVGVAVAVAVAVVGVAVAVVAVVVAAVAVVDDDDERAFEEMAAGTVAAEEFRHRALGTMTGAGL
jgi:hypothetical protein